MLIGRVLPWCGGHRNPYTVSGDPCVNKWGPKNNFLQGHCFKIFFWIPVNGSECCVQVTHSWIVLMLIAWVLPWCGGHWNPYTVSGNPYVNKWGPKNNFLHGHRFKIFFWISENGSECCVYVRHSWRVWMLIEWVLPWFGDHRNPYTLSGDPVLISGDPRITSCMVIVLKYFFGFL